MTSDLQKALNLYLDRRRIARQEEILRNISEMLGEHATRKAAFQTAADEERSTSFLNGLLRERSR